MADCAAAGTARAQTLNGALWRCIRGAGCADVPCVESRCPGELAACEQEGATSVAHGGTSPGNPDPPASPRPSGGRPEDLVGEWHNGAVSSTGYYNAGTGTWSGPSGSGSELTFTADGRFEKAGMLQTVTYGCRMEYFQWSTGRYTVEGDTLVLNEERAEHKLHDGCGKSWEKAKALEVKTYRWRIELEQPGNRPALKLVDPKDGGEKQYSR